MGRVEVHAALNQKKFISASTQPSTGRHSKGNSVVLAESVDSNQRSFICNTRMSGAKSVVMTHSLNA